MNAPIRRSLAAAGATAILLALPTAATADDQAVCMNFVGALEAAGDDCDALASTLDDLAARPKDALAVTRGLESQTCGERFATVFFPKLEGCGDVLRPALAKVETATKQARMGTPDGLLLMLFDNALVFYQEEHVDPDDPMRVSTRLYPLAATQVCTGDAKSAVWAQLRIDPADTDLEACYQSTPDRKSIAIGVKGGDTVHCIRVDALESSPPTMETSFTGCLVDGGTAAASGGAKKTKKPKQAEKTKKPKEPKKAETKAPAPTADEVAALCDYWTDSVTDFGDQCGALGKRMYRKARDLPWRLRDVPRDGAHKAALAVCAKAAEASAHCARDKEFERAMEHLGN